jgi:hypothetical protein
MFSEKTLELDQLKQLSLDELKAYKAKAEERKAELAALKADTKKRITEEQQEELDAIAILLVDVDDIIEAKKESVVYKVPKGEEKLVHLKIVNGHRFNPSTGKEESKPFIQKFTYGEFTVFKNSYSMLGYIVVEVLHDPFNEAHVLIKK